MEAAATGSLKSIIELYVSSPRSFLIISCAWLIEKGGRRSCKFSSLADSSSPIISGLVAKNCPSFINVVPIDSKELDNLSPSFVFSFCRFFLENEIESN